MKIFAIAQQKGGVGKTTTALNLASALATRGDRVLAIDLDPQAALTEHSDIDPDEIKSSIYDALVNGEPATNAVLRTRLGFDILPTTNDLARAELQLPANFNRERVLRKALEPLRFGYDYGIIDCPPHLGLLTINALVASDGVIIPVQPAMYSIRGAQATLQQVAETAAQHNPGLRVVGLIETLVSRAKQHEEMRGFIREAFPEVPILGDVPALVAFVGASTFRKSIYEYSPRSRGAAAYRDITEKVVAHAS